MDVRSEVVKATLVPAENREAVAVAGENQLNKYHKKGLLPVLSRPPPRSTYNGRIRKHCAPKNGR